MSNRKLIKKLKKLTMVVDPSLKDYDMGYLKGISEAIKIVKQHPSEVDLLIENIEAYHLHRQQEMKNIRGMPKLIKLADLNKVSFAIDLIKKLTDHE